MPSPRFFLAEHRGRRFLCAAHYPMRFAVLYDGNHPRLWIGEACGSASQAGNVRTKEMNGKPAVAVVPMREISPTEAREFGSEASRDPQEFTARFDQRYPWVRPQAKAT